MNLPFARLLLSSESAALPDWLLKLLSVDTERLQGGTEHFRFARFPEGSFGLVAILLVFAGFAAVAWNYQREGQLSRSRKIFYSALRCLLLVLVALVLFYPVLEVDRSQELRATTLVLVDDSLSQSIRDRYQGDIPRRDATAKALDMKPEDIPAAARAELLERALESPSLGILSRLSKRNKVKGYAFSGLPLKPLFQEEAPLPVPSSPAAFATEALPKAGTLRILKPEPRGTITDIAGAIRSAVEEEGTGKVAGIVLMTDGRVTAGEDLKSVAAYLHEKNIPVHAVGVGDPSRTRNLRVVTILSSERVFTGDPVVVDGRLDEHGFDGETARVELFDVLEPPGEAPQAPVKVDGQDVTFPTGRSDAPVNFHFQPKGTGRHRLTLRIEPRPEETFTEDNERSTTVEVVKEASKVLLVSGGPSYEYRFLKNLLRRDARVSVAGWLMSADPDYPQEGDVSLKKLPDAARDLFEYDVVILMDVDPQGFPPGFLALLEQFVGKHRGGLLYAAGEKFSGTFLDSLDAAPVRNMLPVVIDAALAKDEVGRGKFHEREWPLEPTPAALDHASTRLSSQPDRNRSRWAEIAGIYWSFPVRKSKPGATVLFIHPDPSLAREGELRPAFLTQFYEGGRVAWCGIDSTWRWRATAEEVYDRFWIQTIRYLTESRLLGDRRRLLQTDRETYDLGDALKISALLEDESYHPIEAEEEPISIEGPDGNSSELRLQRDPAAPGWFRGIYAPRLLGTYKLRLMAELPSRSHEGTGGAPASPPAASEASSYKDTAGVKTVTVEPPALEFEEPRLDEDALRELTSLTGGSYVPLAEIASLPERIPDRRQTVVTTDEPIPLWDNWLSLGLLASLLTIEWILRKVSRLL